ncbi:MAG: hypothetical protein J6T15_05185 [Bacilli bacterium]|nr:hypothetical protein [Bacilli bacterium]
MNNQLKYLNEDGVLFYTQRLKAVLDQLLQTKADTTDITYLEGLINALESGKVDKVSGKQLSTEDYTTSEKTKLEGIESGAEVNVVETIKVNSTALTPDANKAVNISVPTAVSQLTNDSKYQTQTQVNDAITAAIAGVTQIRFEIVQELPQVGENGVIYLVQYGSGPQGNIYQEWIWLSGSQTYETLGSTNQIDLTNYIQFSDIQAITNTEITDIYNSVFNPPTTPPTNPPETTPESETTPEQE